jgi:excisionase family DNA binding protein
MTRMPQPEPSSDDDEECSIEEAAKKCGMSYSRVSELVRTGIIPGTKIYDRGWQWRVKPSTVNAYKERKRNCPLPGSAGWPIQKKKNGQSDGNTESPQDKRSA